MAEVEVLITGKDMLSPSLKGADKAAKDYGSGLEGVGEKADNSEQRILGMKDTVDGVATIMQGPGKAGITGYIQGWADLASGLANFVIPALIQVATAEGRQAIATVASTVATKTAAAATKAWAAVQWVLNAALAANPIGLVIVAIAALVAGIIIAYKKSETFRNIVQGAARAAAAAFQWVVNAIKAVIGWMRANWPLVLGIITGPIGLAVALVAKNWGRISAAARGAVSAIRSAFRGAYNAIAGPVRAAINAITSWINGIVNRIASVGAKARSTLGFLPGFAHGGVVGAASGGPRGGFVMVGEQGRELVRVPPGSSVIPNGKTEQMLAGGASSGGGTIVLNIDIGGQRLGQLLIDPMRRQVKRLGGDVQAVLGA